MANISSESENYSVVANGSVATFRKEVLTLVFSTASGTPLKIKINFLIDSNKQQAIDAQVSTNKDWLNVNIYNAVGIGGTTEPLQIANDDKTGKKLYLSFAFQQVSDSFVVHYTVFEEK